MKDKVDFLLEWAVWAHLDSKTDLELILLKGHLILENTIDTILERKGISGYNKHSFYQKTMILKKIDFNDKSQANFIISSIKAINKLRNKLAHDFYFKIDNGELESWALKILENLEGEKFTNFTFRTKIVHSFSILSINLLKLTH